MNTLSCYSCQSRLVAYLHRQLGPRTARRVAQHIDTCPACYAAYLSQRDLTAELSIGLRHMGEPNQRKLGRLWAAVEADIQRPRPVARRVPVGRFGVALLVLVLALLLPWSLYEHPAVHAVSNLPPVPAATAEVTVAPTLVAMATPVVTARSTYTRIPAAETPATPDLQHIHR